MKNGKKPDAMNATPAFLSCKRILWLAFSVSFLALNPANAVDIPNAACLECHGEEDAEPFIDGHIFGGSVHADNQCVSCHSDITEAEHDTPLKKVACAECHDIEAEIYLQSSHGQALLQGRDQAATCKDCHGDAHHIVYSKNPASPINRANISQTCARCHGDVEQMKQFNLNQLTPIETYEHSVHGQANTGDGSSAATCTDCHGSHNLLKSTNPNSKLYWQNIPQTCGKCHENIAQTYSRSIHGEAVAEGIKDAPTCTDCHGEHEIAAVSSEESKVSGARISETCASCHAAERIITKYRLPRFAVETYMESYHGLSMRLGSVTAANCSSCHGKHDILPSGDPRSSIHPNNLQKTCSVCHAGVTDLVAQGQIHSGTRPGMEKNASTVVRNIYIMLFFIVLGGMLIHNALDLYRKLHEHFKKLRESGGGPHRMTLNERIQHGILASTFIILGYTGFALVNPDAWWARPFVGQTYDIRGLGHRLMAIIFITLSVYHLSYICFTKRGRWQIHQLAPRWSDFVHFGQMIMFYLGLRKERARFEHYSYIEKAEYWALVWGSVVMVITGALLTFEEWTLALFPKWFFDVCLAIHYYEAILACAAIVIWHFYFVMFDPEEYPVKWTAFSGLEGPSDKERLSPEESQIGKKKQKKSSKEEQ
ncbi:cytochrome b/b6 domain-containing protein [Pontiellaceae bacterium B1224]|nr:cytochrome b/b6 domain-containing protein [Pontiellaceae bacterium B1224]